MNKTHWIVLDWKSSHWRKPPLLEQAHSGNKEHRAMSLHCITAGIPGFLLQNYFMLFPTQTPPKSLMLSQSTTSDKAGNAKYVRPSPLPSKYCYPHMLLSSGTRQKNKKKKSHWGKDEGSWHEKMSVPSALAEDGTSRHRQIKGFARANDTDNFPLTSLGFGPNACTKSRTQELSRSLIH